MEVVRCALRYTAALTASTAPTATPAKSENTWPPTTPVRNVPPVADRAAMPLFVFPAMLASTPAAAVVSSAATTAPNALTRQVAAPAILAIISTVHSAPPAGESRGDV